MHNIVTRLTVIVFICLIIFGLFFITTYKYWNNQTIEIEVKDKFVKEVDSRDIYMIVDTNNNTYEITDMFFKWKFNSTDLYNELEIGHKYKVETSGFRVHIFSHYKNINKIEKLD